MLKTKTCKKIAAVLFALFAFLLLAWHGGLWNTAIISVRYL